MKIFINEKAIETTHKNIGEILEEQGINKTNVAVAVNNKILPKTDWNTTEIKENDNILIIKATCGG